MTASERFRELFADEMLQMLCNVGEPRMFNTREWVIYGVICTLVLGMTVLAVLG